MALKLWDYSCEECQTETEILVKDNEKDEQNCETCGGQLNRLLAAVTGWVPSFERTQKMMKDRSKAHTARCIKKDISMADNDSGISSDPVWRNKHRKKNTSRDTIQKFKNIHEDWTKKPAIERI